LVIELLIGSFSGFAIVIACARSGVARFLLKTYAGKVLRDV
jgi:hypothetical protein